MVKADETARRVEEAIPEFHKVHFCLNGYSCMDIELLSIVYLCLHSTVIVTNLQNVITSVGPSVNYPFLLRFTVLVLSISCHLIRKRKMEIHCVVRSFVLE
jgi:hypothetical protein